MSPRVLGGQFSPRRVLSLCVWKCRDQTAWVPGWKTGQNLFFCPAPSRAMLLDEGSLTGAQRSPATALVFENRDSSSCDAGPAGRTQATPSTLPSIQGVGGFQGAGRAGAQKHWVGGRFYLEGLGAWPLMAQGLRHPNSGQWTLRARKRSGVQVPVASWPVVLGWRWGKTFDLLSLQSNSASR